MFGIIQLFIRYLIRAPSRKVAAYTILMTKIEINSLNHIMNYEMMGIFFYVKVEPPTRFSLNLVFFTWPRGWELDLRWSHSGQPAGANISRYDRIRWSRLTAADTLLLNRSTVYPRPETNRNPFVFSQMAKPVLPEEDHRHSSLAIYTFASCSTLRVG